jgi:hypothetical protein
MTEQELRQLVRQAIGRVRTPTAEGRVLVDPPDQHASHAIFPVESGADQNGPCIIEPAVMCNHCGYCKSLGH